MAKRCWQEKDKFFQTIIVHGTNIFFFKEVPWQKQVHIYLSNAIPAIIVLNVFDVAI